MKRLTAQLNAELLRLFARKRTHIGFGVFALLEIVFLVLLHSEASRRWIERSIDRYADGAFDEYFSALTLAVLILRFSVILLGGLYLALVAGDIVSKEVEDGTLRMLLARPISRLRLLSLKYTSCCLYTGALVAFMGITAFLLGSVARGWGGGLFLAVPEKDVFVLSPFGDGLQRYLSALPFLGLSLLTVSSIGFMLSCYPMKPAAATILTLSVLLSDLILRSIPALSDFEPWFLTTHMSSWIHLFERPVPWTEVGRSYALLLAVNASCFVFGWLGFAGRDLKS